MNDPETGDATSGDRVGGRKESRSSDGRPGRVKAKGVISTVHLPPPVHGMSVASAAFVEIVRREADATGTHLECRRISAERRAHRICEHLSRIGRVAGAAAAIIRQRKRARSIYVSADADVGMVYTMFIAGAARVAGLTIYVHHHSASYLQEQPARRLRMLCRIGGPSAEHILACDAASHRFNEFYPGSPTKVLPMWFAIDRPREGPQNRLTHAVLRRPDRIRLGHLSNLSIEKGLEEVFASAELLSAAGRAVEVVLAGKCSSPREERLLASKKASADFPLDYRGPVFGVERERFFGDIDVFLFPSRYRHEYTPLVIGEALTRGVPVLAHSTLCCTSEELPEGMLLIRHDEEFPARCHDWVEDRLADDALWTEAVHSAGKFQEVVRSATERAEHLARHMLGVEPDSASSVAQNSLRFPVNQ